MTKATTPPTKRAHKPRPPVKKRRQNEEYEHRKTAQGLKRIQLWVLPEDAPRFFAIAKTRRDRALTKVAHTAPA